jgi:hypothetical protein
MSIFKRSGVQSGLNDKRHVASGSNWSSRVSGTLYRIVLGREMPNEDGKLAGRRKGGHVLPARCPDPWKESA